MKNVYICIIVIVISVLCVRAYAAEYTYEKNASADEILTGGWQDLMEFLPEDIREEISGLDPVSGEGIENRIGFRYWGQKILQGSLKILDEHLPGILPLFSMMLFMAAVELSMDKWNESGMRDAFRMLSNLASSVMLFGMTEKLIAGTEVYLDRICGIMNLLVPVMEGIYLAGGNLTQKAVTTEAVMIAVTLVGNFTGHLLVPLTHLLFTLSCLGSVCTEVKLSGFTSGLRKFIMRLWQFGTLLFSFLLSVQSILAKSADSLAAKTARFAIGTFIPVAGGAIAEAFSTLKEGINVLRNAAGIGGIIVILLLLIPGILPLILHKCTLSLAETAADGMNLGSMRGILAEIHGITDMLFAFVLYTSLMFILVLVLFIKAQVGG